MRNNRMISFQVVILLICHILINNVQAQDTSNFWIKRNEGYYEVIGKIGRGESPFSFKYNNYVILPLAPEESFSQIQIDGTWRMDPIHIWSLDGDSFITMSNNWTDSSISIHSEIYYYDTSHLFITDHYNIWRADIDYIKKTIFYEKVFVGTKNFNRITAYCKGNNNVYFADKVGFDTVYTHLYICNKLGQLINDIKLPYSVINRITTMVEWSDTLYCGYDYIGGASDGAGLAVLNKTTNKLIKLTNTPFAYNIDGTYVYEMNGHFYLSTNPGGKYYLYQWSLFEYIKGKWTPLVAKCSGPFVSELGDTVINTFASGSINMKTGDTLNYNDTFENFYYHFNNGQVGSKISSWRDSVWPFDYYNIWGQFDEEFKTQFYQRHSVRGNMPYIYFRYNYKGKVVGFGGSIVAELMAKVNASNTEFTKNEFHIYPVPSSHEIKVPELTSPINYIIYSIDGKIIQHGTTTKLINIDNLANGVYILKLYPNGITGKFIKIE